MAYTAIVGRRLNAAIINLGFSGSGVMEPELAELLAELNPSVYVLDTLANMSVEQVSERVEPFVTTLRAAHESTPILLVEEASSKGISPTDRGRAARAEYEKLTARGVKNLHFLSNQGLLGDDGEGTVDGVHPNDLGMMRHADVFTRALAPLMPASP
jgi:lysophospholipase L1-like esterase